MLERACYLRRSARIGHALAFEVEPVTRLVEAEVDGNLERAAALPGSLIPDIPVSLQFAGENAGPDAWRPGRGQVELPDDEDFERGTAAALLIAKFPGPAPDRAPPRVSHRLHGATRPQPGDRPGSTAPPVFPAEVLHPKIDFRQRPGPGRRQPLLGLRPPRGGVAGALELVALALRAVARALPSGLPGVGACVLRAALRFRIARHAGLPCDGSSTRPAAPGSPAARPLRGRYCDPVAVLRGAVSRKAASSFV